MMVWKSSPVAASSMLMATLMMIKQGARADILANCCDMIVSQRGFLQNFIVIQKVVNELRGVIIKHRYEKDYHLASECFPAKIWQAKI
ncbi:exported hypothetical protein [anaerobic digester metagenome]|jgi:hypothetical protein|uniref:Uncharacterized protein n=1 Tax=anaerobic digester metagenome TaxID=1263854 RepID=A0A485MCE7_9ZZZZ